MKRALITLLLLGVASLSFAQGNVYTCPSYSTLNGMGTNGTSVIANLPLLLPDGTISAPSLGFSSDNGIMGFYRFAPSQTAFVVGGNLGNLFRSNETLVNQLKFDVNSQDLVLTRDAANTLALRNLTNAQTFNIYNTYTDASNYERGFARWNTSVFELGTEKLGSGSARDMTFVVGAGNIIKYTAAYLAPAVDDSYAIGNSDKKITNGYFSRSLQGSKSKSLTDAGAAVSIERVAVPTNGYMGAFTYFTANSTDGTNRLTTSGLVTWAAADTGGTVTCGTPVVTGLVTAYKRANTLVCTFSTAVATTNCDLQVTCTDNLAGTQTMSIEHFLMMPTINTYTPQ